MVSRLVRAGSYPHRVGDDVQRRIVVTGRVQGVGYRASCLRVATSLSLRGGVRNREDGSVEVLVAGAPEQVDRLTEWCRDGPPAARVDRVNVVDEPGVNVELEGPGWFST